MGLVDGYPASFVGTPRGVFYSLPEVPSIVGPPLPTVGTFSLLVPELAPFLLCVIYASSTFTSQVNDLHSNLCLRDNPGPMGMSGDPTERLFGLTSA